MITKLRWKNCFCFRGEYKIDLGPGVYAITAKYEDDDGRSNWAGKTSLMKLLGPMPLFGDHGVGLEDDWITSGETEAFYEITLDSGIVIRRERTKGKSTQILFIDGARRVGQKGAQREIEAAIGLTEADFFASCYFKQKETDKLISLTPGDRQELVSGWLGLAPLQACYEKTKDELLEVSKEVSKYETLVGESKAAIEQILSAIGLQTVSEVESEIANASASLSLKSSEAVKAGEFVTKAARLAVAHDRREAAREAILKLDQEWISLTDALDKIQEPPIRRLTELYSDVDSEYSKVASECVKLSVLAEGEFDGKCPVSQGVMCPIRDSINSMKDKHRTELSLARDRYVSVDSKKREAKRALDAAMAAASSRNTLLTKISEVEKKTRELRVQAEVELDPVPDYDVSARASILNQEVGQLQSKIWSLTKAKNDLLSHTTALASRETVLSDLKSRQSRLSEAAAIFKLAQTKCAEDGVAEIEDGANDLLADAGINLSVKIAWEKETHGLAKNCDNCGSGFPTSTKVRACSNCQTPRGNHYIEKLRVTLSDTSGGAEDLGGLAIQLSAAAFLRNLKGSQFDIAYLDEVASALDVSNRRALGRHISNMITGRFGFRQGFVVSHSPDIDAMFQGRIEILVKKDGSRTVTVV